MENKKKELIEIIEDDYTTTLGKVNLIFSLFNDNKQIEQLNCDCCNGSGMVEGDYRDELESCLTCNGRGTF